MIGTCEACSKTNVPVRLWNFSGMDTVQCFRCVGDAEADPYGELMDPPPFCTCPCSCDETPHHGKNCPVHGCHLYGDGACDLTPSDQRCKDCPCDKSLIAAADDQAGMAWWNGLTEPERAKWAAAAGNTGRAKDAWEFFKQADSDAAITAMVAVAKRDKPDECEYPHCKCPRVGRCGKASA